MDIVSSDSLHHKPIIPKSPGIYKITCLANKKIYVGSAVNLQQRRRQHFSDLRQKKHDNRHLQNAYNKYGEEAFIFEVVELVLVVELLTVREQYYLDTLKPFGRRGFNILPTADSKLGIKHSPESIERIRQAKMGNTYNLGRKQTPEHRENSRKAKLNQSAETRAKISASKKGKKPSPKQVEFMRNRVITPETRLKLSQSHLGKSPSAETREKLRQANLGKKMPLEAIERMRQSKMGNTYGLGKKHTPESIEKMRQSKLNQSPETRKKIGDANRGRKRSPETIEKLKQRPQSQKGHKHTDATKENMRKAQAARRQSEREKQ